MKKRSQQDEETASTVIGNDDEKMLDRLPDPVILVPAPSEQKHFSTFRKWFILFIVALQGFLGPLSSSIYVPAIHEVRRSLGVSSTVINATISLYVFTQGIAPMMWAALSERYGRRLVYISATVLYVGSTVGCGVSPNIGIFVVMRILQSIGASAAQAVGAGTITDLFPVKERGNAMGLFFLGPLIGPVVGPIAGGYINQYLGWPYIFWTLAGMGGLVLILMLFFLPETADRRRNPPESMQKTFIRPFQYLLKPVVILASTPYALAYGFMYFVISSLPHQLGYRYHMNSSQIGLSYLANGVGNAVGAVISGYLADWFLQRSAVGADAAATRTEMRLKAMWLAIVLLPLGDLMYGWCIQYRVHPIAGLGGLFILGVGVGVVQTPSNTYLVDAYQGYSASVVGASNLLRSTCAGLTPLAAPALLRAIGNGWSMTLMAIISIVSGACVYLVQTYGERWRALPDQDNLASLPPPHLTSLDSPAAVASSNTAVAALHREKENDASV